MEPKDEGQEEQEVPLGDVELEPEEPEEKPNEEGAPKEAGPDSVDPFERLMSSLAADPVLAEAQDLAKAGTLKLPETAEEMLKSASPEQRLLLAQLVAQAKGAQAAQAKAKEAEVLVAKQAQAARAQVAADKALLGNLGKRDAVKANVARLEKQAKLPVGADPWSDEAIQARVAAAVLAEQKQFLAALEQEAAADQAAAAREADLAEKQAYIEANPDDFDREAPGFMPDGKQSTLVEVMKHFVQQRGTSLPEAHAIALGLRERFTPKDTATKGQVGRARGAGPVTVNEPPAGMKPYSEEWLTWWENHPEARAARMSQIR